MTPPNLCLVSWTGITGGASNGVDTAASARRILGHARGYVRGMAGLASHFKKVHHCCGLRQCHGASKAELVKLQPDWLEQFQKYVSGLEKLPSLCLSRWTGSREQHIAIALGGGIVELNVDTDTRWAYREGTVNFYQV